MFTQSSVAALKIECENISKIMGAKDVRTTFSGTGAYTNGKTVNIPAMDMTSTLTVREQAIIRGYHIHEVEHVATTNFDLLKKRRPDNKLKSTWNCVEDAFIERRAISKYAGAKRSLQTTLDHVLKGEREHWEGQPEEERAERDRAWWRELPYAALQTARKDLGYEGDEIDAYLKRMPKKLASLAKQYAKKIAECESTEDCYEVAKSIRRKVKSLERQDEKEQEQGRRDQGQEQEDQEQQEQEQEGGAGRNREGEGEDEQEESKSRGQSDADEGEGDDKGGADAESESDDESEDEGETTRVRGGAGFDLEAAQDRASDAMSRVFDAHKSDVDEGVRADMAEVHDSHLALWLSLQERHKNSSDTIKDMAKTHVNGLQDRQDRIAATTKRAKEQIGNDVKQYSARLARLLLAQEDRRQEGGYTRGRVDRRRLAQLVAGSENVFAQMREASTDETRIMIAVDGSGSMSFSKTMAAALAVNECLGRAGVKYELSEWSGYEMRSQPDFHPVPFIIMHKRINDSWRKADRGFLFQHIGGGTPTLSVLTAYAAMMGEWREPRKILIVLTDGVPDGYDKGEIKACGKFVGKMREAGFEVYGVAIDTNERGFAGEAMTTMFGTPVFTDGAALGKTLLGGLEALLLKKGKAHAA